MAQHISVLISAITIYFLFLTYQETSLQNQQINIAGSLQRIVDQINGFNYSGKQGIEAINELKIAENHSINWTYYNQMMLIVTLFENHLFLIENNPLFTEKRKSNLNNQAYTLFYSKLLWPFYEAVKKNYQDFNPKVNPSPLHDDFGISIFRFARIALATLNFLGQKKNIVIRNTKMHVIDDLNQIISDLKHFQEE